MNTHTHTHTDDTRSWLDELAVELRLRHVRGEAIGDAVSSVESHLAESGESATEAFGDPRSYAESLEFPPDQYVSTSPASWTGVLAPVVTGILGLTLAVDTVPALRDGHAVEVTWGRLAALALLALIMVTAARALGPILRHPVLSSVTFGVAVVGLGLLPVLLQTPAFTVPALPALAVAGLFLVASVVTGYRQRSQPADRITDPVSGTDRYPDARPAGLVRPLVPWVFVLATLGLGAVTWFWGG